VRRLVLGLRRSFPSSTLVWRLMHPGSKHSISPAVVRVFNDAVRGLAEEMQLPLLDVHGGHLLSCTC
jgi:hypothetical protein